jgi:MtfA peptidase
MFFVVFVLALIYLVFNQFGGTYALSSILPPSIRRNWIKIMYYVDYLNWDYYDQLLIDNFPYYKILNKKQKHEFMVRLIDVKNTMEFEGQQGFVLTDEKLCFLSASMVQLTFGFPNYRFSHFKKVIILPVQFYSRYLNADVQGLTVGAGYIYLAWSHFAHGYNEYKNRKNLGLHEFAHALCIQKPLFVFGERYDELQRHYTGLSRLRNNSLQELELIRDYAFTNVHEFWAVVVEVFFEQPIELKHQHVFLYRFIGKILRQDMAKKLDQYVRQKTSLTLAQQPGIEPILRMP